MQAGELGGAELSNRSRYVMGGEETLHSEYMAILRKLGHKVK